MVILKNILKMRSVAGICFSIILLFSCRSHDVTVNGHVSSRNVVERVVSDSVVLHDSIYIRERSDTVFFTKYRTMYKEVMRHDTVVRCDTLLVERVVTVEEKQRKSIAWWQGLSVAALLLLLWRSGLFGTLWRMLNKK